MNYFSTLYVDEKSNKLLHKKKLLPFGKKKLYKLPLQCIYFPEDGERMEFTLLKNLDHPYFHHHQVLVAGFACDETNAIAILRNLIERTYSEEETLDYKSYLQKNNSMVKKISEVTSFVLVEPVEEEDE